MTELASSTREGALPVAALTQGEEWVWRGLVQFVGETSRTLTTSLQASVGLTLLEFDLLGFLYDEHDHCMVMNELAERIQITPSGITRMVDRLVARGLVERRNHPGDGRRYLAVLSVAGVELYEKTTPLHHEAIRQQFLSHLEPTERVALGALWHRLLKTPE